MIQLIRRAATAVAAVAMLGAMGACEDEIPTATGYDLFPGGASPTTVVTEFGGADLLLRQEVYEGFGNPRLTPFLVVANDFDDELDANSLVRFTEFPDSVTYGVAGSSRRDSIASYAGGRLLVEVDSLASHPVATTRLLVYELTQGWDSTSVSWDHAVDRPGEQVPWTTAGGSVGTLLDADFWFPGDTASRDTVTLELDSAAVSRLRSEGHPGLLITTDQPGTRLKLSGFTFEGDARPAGDADTLVQVRTMEGPQSFVYTPDEPENPDVLASGGLTGSRSVLILDLEQEVEACPEGGGECTSMPLSEVTLNRAQLVLQALPVPGGHRPLATPSVQLRQVAEPELGRYAPLGAALAQDTITPAAFSEEGGGEFTLDLTSALLRYRAEKARAESEGGTVDPELGFAILTTYQVPDIGLLWFDRSPRLRVVYTLPLNPSLP